MGAKKAFTVLLTGILLLSFLFFISRCNLPAKIKPDNLKVKIELGRYLFFDTRLSFNSTKSCGSCHDPKFAFTDGYRNSITAGGENVKHNAPSLVNSVFMLYFDWANPTVTSLEKQHERPLFNETPVELGAKGNELAILEKLKADSFYKKQFALAFVQDKNPFQFSNIIESIAAFNASIQSYNSPYDKFIVGDSNALSLSAKAGLQLFFSDRLNCSSCHAGKDFTTATLTKNIDSIYFNTGLYNLLNKNIYPADDNGLVSVTNKKNDDGKFKVPSLRNVGITTPYMHDGSINTLSEVIDMYATGGRKIEAGPLSGDGSRNTLKDKRINGFAITNTEKKQLVDFLFSLSDSTVLTNPAFQNPFNLINK